jgi:predicted transposase YbfD/YdcC
MEEELLRASVEAFEELEDPRGSQGRQHRLVDIVSIALVAVLAGADNFCEIEEFGKAKETWLRRFLALPGGIPSHDTFNRVFSLVNPSKWQGFFLAWVGKALAGKLGAEHICIDGKELNGSGQGDYERVRQVSAWASQRGLALAQLRVEETSNEITVLPNMIETLDLFDLSGCLVSLDAMGTQREVASMLHERGCRYIQALKDNQAKLAEDVRWLFEDAQKHQTLELPSAQSHDKAHGREEIRRCYLSQELDFLSVHAWPGLQAVAMLESSRTLKDKTSLEKRYFLLNYRPSPSQFLADVRAHWAIENCLHWVLDVVFHEDDHSLSKDHAPQNFNILRQLALNLIKLDPSKGSIKAKRKRAAWNLPFLESLLANLQPQLLA